MSDSTIVLYEQRAGVDFAEVPPVLGEFVGEDAEARGEFGHGREIRFCGVGDLPVGHLGRVEFHRI